MGSPTRQQAKVHRIIERASPQKPSGTATLRQAADVAGQLPYSSAGLHSGVPQQCGHNDKASIPAAESAAGREVQSAFSNPIEQKHATQAKDEPVGVTGAQAATNCKARRQPSKHAM